MLAIRDRPTPTHLSLWLFWLYNLSKDGLPSRANLFPGWFVGGAVGPFLLGKADNNPVAVFDPRGNSHDYQSGQCVAVGQGLR